MIDPAIASLLVTAAGFILTFFSVTQAVNKGSQETSVQTGKILQSIDDLRTNVSELKRSLADNVKDIRAQLEATIEKRRELEKRVQTLEQYAHDDYKKFDELDKRLEEIENGKK